MESKKEYFAPMHTAEHVLSGAIARRYGCGRPFGTHIERKKSKIDFRTDARPTPEELAAIEAGVNEVLAEGLAVSEEFLPRGEAAARYDLSRVPAADGVVRVVHVGNVDACPCVGEHVTNTAEIPPLRIVSADGAEGVLRIRFKLEEH